MRVIGWLVDDTDVTVCTGCANTETDTPVINPDELDDVCSICGKYLK